MNDYDSVDIEKTVKYYKKSYDMLKNYISKSKYSDNFIHLITKDNSNITFNKFIQDAIYLPSINQFLDVVKISHARDCKLDLVADIYFSVRKRFHIDKITDMVYQNEEPNHIERMANDYLDNELRQLSIKLTVGMIKNSKSGGFAVDQEKMSKYNAFVEKIFMEANEENSNLVVQILLNKLKELVG